MRNLKRMENIYLVIQASNIDETIENRLWRKIDNEKTVLEFLIGRLQENGCYDISIATTTESIDDGFVQLAKKCKVNIHRGSFFNIPQRLLGAIPEGQTDFVRVNANSPLLDVKKMEELVNKHKEGNYDYSYNEHREGLIWGMGCEVFNVAFLRKLSEGELTDSQKETIGQYIRQNDDVYYVLRDCVHTPFPQYKVNIETERDYELVGEIAKNVLSIDSETVIRYLDKHPVIAKYNREEPPKETGIEKLFFSQEKVNNILLHRLPDMSYPISVELTLTNKCNLNCVYCSDKDLRVRQGRNEQLDLGTLKRLFDDLASGGTKGVVLEGGGEPTIYPFFSEVVQYAKSVGLAVGLITNGTQTLDVDILSSLEWIRVSLDASTAEEYHALKGVDCFEKVIDNIAIYAKSCESVGVGYVVTNNNISKIESLVIRLRELGATYIQCRPVVDNPELFPKGVDLSYLKYYETRHFGVEIGGMRDNSAQGNAGVSCVAHSITSIISGDGSVYICGRLNIYPWLKPIGNIIETDFRKIWYGIERQNQAEMIINGDFCRKNCPQCRITKFNQMFSRLENVQSPHFI